MIKYVKSNLINLIKNHVKLICLDITWLKKIIKAH